MGHTIKKDIYVCNACKVETCYCSANIPGPVYRFETCINSPEPNWKKTTEYELVRKDPGGVKLGIKLAKAGTFPNTPEPPPKRKICDDINLNLFGTKEQMKEFLMERVDPELKTPNCSICEWRKLEDAVKNMDSGFVYHQEHQCTAQGYRYIKNVYGNKICKRLFVDDTPNRTVCTPPTETAK